MNSEKVKDKIRELIDCDKKQQNEFSGMFIVNRQFLIEALTLINELDSENKSLQDLCNKTYKDLTKEIDRLESENERLLNEKWDKEDDLDNYHIENQQLKDRIAELTKKNKILQGAKDRLTFADRITLVNNAKEIALKQFAERLKEKVHERDYVQGYAEIGLCEEIDETLKEFLGEQQ